MLFKLVKSHTWKEEKSSNKSNNLQLLFSILMQERRWNLPIQSFQRYNAVTNHFTNHICRQPGPWGKTTRKIRKKPLNRWFKKLNRDNNHFIDHIYKQHGQWQKITKILKKRPSQLNQSFQKQISNNKYFINLIYKQPGPWGKRTKNLV